MRVHFIPYQSRWSLRVAIFYFYFFDRFIIRVGHKTQFLSRTLFPNYTGGGDFEAACEFLKARFLELAGNNVQVHTHFTCAVDTRNIEYVIKDVRVKVLLDIANQISNF